MKKVIEDSPEIDNKNINDIDQKEIMNFLTEIRSTIEDIRKSDKKQYSLLSSIFNCFYENKKMTLSRQTIYEYIYKDIINYKGKMIISFVINGTNSKELINEENYIKKTNSIILRNKCLVTEGEDCISINVNFTKLHKKYIYRILFGKDAKYLLDDDHTNIKKLKKPKQNSLEAKSNNDNNKDKNENNNNNVQDEKLNQDDDFEIEILDSEQDETDTSDLSKINNNFIINSNIPKNESNTEPNKNINKNNHIINLAPPIKKKKAEKQLLKKKRKNKNAKINVQSQKDNNQDKAKKLESTNSTFNDTIETHEQNKEEKNNINIILTKNEENNNCKKEKDQNVAEKEILSLIEEGKLFLSLFKDKELLHEFESNNNTTSESDSFIKSILLSYQNGDILKNFLNILNDDFTEFQNSIKSLILFKTTLDEDKSDKFMAKFSIMNKIILGKEKCNLLIDKIVIKLKQLIMEFNYIKKVMNSFDSNKADAFQKFKDIISNGSNTQEKDNYVNNVKMKLQDELSKALVNGKVEEKSEK